MAGLAAYADAIEEAGAGHDRITLVAQSMGGFSAPLVVGRLPVEEIVLVNAMIPAPGETAGAWWANTGHDDAHAARARTDGRTITDEFDVIAEFFHDVSDDVIREVFSRREPRQPDRLADYLTAGDRSAGADHEREQLQGPSFDLGREGR